MNKMDQTQFTKACGALASAWDVIREDGFVYAVGNDLDGMVSVQTQWEDFRECFHSELISFSKRGVEQVRYPWEAATVIEGVRVFALLTDEQKNEADKEAE